MVLASIGAAPLSLSTSSSLTIGLERQMPAVISFSLFLTLSIFIILHVRLPLFFYSLYIYYFTRDVINYSLKKKYDRRVPCVKIQNV